MRGFFSSPPPPPSPLERLRVILAPFASSSTASFMLRLAVTAYGALLCASLLSARAAFGARKIHDAARATAHLALSSERRRSPCVASAVAAPGPGAHLRQAPRLRRHVSLRA